jgi:tartrate/fumarate subfamily iron-sulfur-dependent hydro-lyase alpha chain
MIDQQILEKAMFHAMKKAALLMPSDVRGALEKAMGEEANPVAREHLRVTLENADLAERGEGLVCGDTGFPLYFIRVVGDPQIEGNFRELKKIARTAVVKATEESYLRPTMVDPISRDNPGNNLGTHIPAVDIEFTPSDTGDGGMNNRLEILAAPKGGGSEIFGTFYRMMYPADGMAGVLKFIVDSVRSGSYAGKVCPPAIVGVGIGGTADICMKMAKRAALLRMLGSRHPDPQVASLEEKLEKNFEELGLGPMGAEGKAAVLSVHLEKEVTHTAALPVAVNAQCCIGRRWSVIVPGNAKTEEDLIYSDEVPKGFSAAFLEKEKEEV